MEEKTEIELPEVWYDEVKDLFQIKVDDESLKEDIKPIIIGMSETLSEYNNAVIAESTVFVSNRIGNYLSKNSKGKPKQKGSKYF